jgi:hypothetical protein
MYQVAFITNRDEAQTVVDSAFARSCDSPYSYWIIVNRKEKLVVVSRRVDTDLPKMEVPSWSLRGRYERPRIGIRMLGLGPFFVFDTISHTHVLRYKAISTEVSARMLPSRDKLLNWVWKTLYENI